MTNVIFLLVIRHRGLPKRKALLIAVGWIVLRRQLCSWEGWKIIQNWSYFRKGKSWFGLDDSWLFVSFVWITDNLLFRVGARGVLPLGTQSKGAPENSAIKLILLMQNFCLKKSKLMQKLHNGKKYQKLNRTSWALSPIAHLHLASCPPCSKLPQHSVHHQAASIVCSGHSRLCHTDRMDDVWDVRHKPVCALRPLILPRVVCCPSQLLTKVLQSESSAN